MERHELASDDDKNKQHFKKAKGKCYYPAQQGDTYLALSFLDGQARRNEDGGTDRATLSSPTLCSKTKRLRT